MYIVGTCITRTTGTPLSESESRFEVWQGALQPSVGTSSDVTLGHSTTRTRSSGTIFIAARPGGHGHRCARARGNCFPSCAEGCLSSQNQRPAGGFTHSLSTPKRAMGQEDQLKCLVERENRSETSSRGTAPEAQPPPPPRENIMFGTLFRNLLLLYLLAVFALVVGKPVLEKRATQVSLISYTYANGVLAGSINVRAPCGESRYIGRADPVM